MQRIYILEDHGATKQIVHLSVLAYELVVRIEVSFESLDLVHRCPKKVT